jgi:hypothetical protein
MNFKNFSMNAFIIILCFLKKLDKAENGDIENCYENAHLPEVGFKGSYLTG